MDGHTRCERCNHWIPNERMDWHMRIGHSPGVEGFLTNAGAALRGEKPANELDIVLNYIQGRFDELAVKTTGQYDYYENGEIIGGLSELESVKDLILKIKRG